MTKTVAPSYVKTCFNYKMKIKNWYDVLKQQVGLNKYAIKQELINMYKHAIKPLSKMPKDIDFWITNWEQTMAEGLDQSLYYADNVSIWFEDFLAAVKLIDSVWMNAYQIDMSKEVESGTLSYRILANDFHKEIKVLRTNAKVSRIAKRSFGPTFAEQSAEEKMDVSDASTKIISKRKKKKTGKQFQD